MYFVQNLVEQGLAVVPDGCVASDYGGSKNKRGNVGDDRAATLIFVICCGRDFIEVFKTFAIGLAAAG